MSGGRDGCKRFTVQQLAVASRAPVRPAGWTPLMFMNAQMFCDDSLEAYWAILPQLTRAFRDYHGCMVYPLHL